jgi:hypothetical protein
VLKGKKMDPKVSYLSEEEVKKIVKDKVNVAETWSLHDTILVCNTYYGAEQNINTWFNSFFDFSRPERHFFFKNRTKGTAGLPYSNRNNADTMDFAFVAFTWGISWFGPSVAVQGTPSIPDGAAAGDVAQIDPYSTIFWQSELPNQSAIQLKIQQDVVAELPCSQCMPGYGPSGGNGAAFDLAAPVANASRPMMNNVITQGPPFGSNRWRFPSPLGIPRTASIEAILDMSQYSRDALAQMTGPFNVAFQSQAGGPPYTFFPARFGVQVALHGVRMVQQRGQYFK